MEFIKDKTLLFYNYCANRLDLQSQHH